jgi:hypothetical protein
MLNSTQKIKIKCYKPQVMFLQIENLITNRFIVARGKRIMKVRTGKCEVLPITCHEGHREE